MAPVSLHFTSQRCCPEIKSVMQLNKRRKIEVACEVCRVRKTRCDGGRPKCSACLKRRNVGHYCTYTSTNHDSTAHYPLEISTRQPQHFTDPSRKHTSVQPIFTSTSPPADIQARKAFHNVTIQDGEVQSDWILRAGLLAASSSAKFFKTVFGNSDHSKEPLETDRETVLDDLNAVNEQRSIATGAPYDLPPRAQVDALLDRFWTHVYIQWFDRDEFLGWYESIWSQETHIESTDGRLRFAILNLVLALVYRTEPDFEDDKDNMAKIHFGRAHDLLHVNVLDLDNMDLLYALFLMLQWYQSVNNVRQCLSLTRLCLLVARNLGIDDAERVTAFESQRQREMARRAWHGCILIDRIIAMVSGRPPQISQSIARTIPLFASIDDQFLSTNGEDGFQIGNVVSQQEFFHQFCKLHLILGDILLYHHSTGNAIDLNQIIELDTALHQFEESLPQELRYDITNVRYLGQAVHLRTRLLYIRILLFRPFFTHATLTLMRHNCPSTFADTVVHGGLVKCVNTAIELVDLLDSRHAAGNRRPGIIPQWWHTIGYVYSASTVVIAAHLFPGISSIKQPDLEKAIQQGFSVLDSYKRSRQSAQLCRKALDTLYTRYVRKDTTDGPPNNQSREAEACELPWAWESVLDLFDEDGMFDFGQSD